MANKIAPGTLLSFNALNIGQLNTWDLTINGNPIETKDLADAHIISGAGQPSYEINATVTGTSALAIHATGAMIVTYPDTSTASINGTEPWFITNLGQNYEDNGAITSTIKFEPFDAAS